MNDCSFSSGVALLRDVRDRVVDRVATELTSAWKCTTRSYVVLRCSRRTGSGPTSRNVHQQMHRLVWRTDHIRQCDLLAGVDGGRRWVSYPHGVARRPFGARRDCGRTDDGSRGGSLSQVSLVVSSVRWGGRWSIQSMTARSYRMPRSSTASVNSSTPAATLPLLCA